MVLTTVPALIAFALRGWCLRNGFSGQVPLWRACYSDLPSVLQTVGRGGSTGEPVVTAVVLELLAGLVGGTGPGGQALFVVLWGLLALVLLAVCAVAIAAYRSFVAGDRDRALLFVLCPALPLGLLISADLLGVTLMTAGLLAWRLRRDATAGVLLALATFSRSVALMVVVAVIAREVVPAVRSGWPRRPLRRFVVGFTGGVAALLALGVTLGVQSLTEPVLRWWQASAGYGSLWVLPNVAASTTPSYRGDGLRRLVADLVIPDGLAPVLGLAGWALAIGLVGWLAARSWGRPTTADLALLGVAVVLVTSPALTVQASLWLVPLVALSSLPWRDMLIWAGAEVLYFPMVWLYLGGLQNPSRGLPGGWYALFLLLRLLAIGYLAWRVAENSRFSPPSTRGD